MEERLNVKTPQELLNWSIAHSDPEAIKNVDKSKLMSHEEFQEMWKEVFPDVLSILKEKLAFIQTNPALEDLHKALDNILFIVEGIDEADWFADLHGFQIILEFLKNENTETRRAAAWIISNALQNNPKVQKKFFEQVGIQPLLDALSKESESPAAIKLFGAISSAIRGFEPMRYQFYEKNGIDVLKAAASKFPDLAFRFCWLVGALLDTSTQTDRDTLKGGSLKEFMLAHKTEINDDDILNSVIVRL